MGNQIKLEIFRRRGDKGHGQAEGGQSVIGKEDGFISVLIVLVITLLACIGVESLTLVQAQSKIVREEAAKVRCVFLAEGGLEWARACLSTNSEWRGGRKSYSDGESRISVEPTEEGFIIVSETQSGTAHRRVKVLLQKEDRLDIVRYEELFN